MHAFLMLGYSIAYSIGALIYLPLAAWRRLIRGKSSSIVRRFGSLPARAAPGSIWVHAVSVGEVNAVQPLVAALCERGHAVIISTTTPTGRSVARNHFPDLPIFYFPLDLRWICRRALRQLSPRLVLLAETELWPNFLAAAHSRRVPVGIVNGRLSDASFRGYRRIRFLLRPLLSKVASAWVQSERDARRLGELGVPGDRIAVGGNLKYDVAPPDPDQWAGLRRRIRGVLGAGAGPTWLCGSTREGEEEQLLTVLAELRSRHPDLKLILVPRHPHRAAELEAELAARRLKVLRRSTLESGHNGVVDVVLVDTVGELAGLYELADVVFVGGSLVPTGGQNIVEPAVAGRPILFGPHMDNFRDIAAGFLARQAAIQVRDSAHLEQELDALLDDEPRRRLLGERALQVVAANRGSLQRTVEGIERLLQQDGAGAC